MLRSVDPSERLSVLCPELKNGAFCSSDIWNTNRKSNPLTSVAVRAGEYRFAAIGATYLYGRQRHWNIGGSQVERRRRENRGAVGGEEGWVWGGAVALPRKFLNFFYQNGVALCILGVLFLRFICPMDCSCMINFILGGRQHRTTPACQILRGRDPCNPCGVDAA